ncbi:V-type ATP synthase subunit E [Mahella australiensis]|uniref:V-type proton ATPase subunit E n=1 Tax=Mahella australiensis (strain DSM 15567 / CIP 107919 / 50-1 BON) TaxID=697281 RepID=F4A012_MAHA5|nr:V-type ATP synthase subunit E [Mahella australiensis]AEE95830.1 H+transporting two-sector ATPase E subunit [Mahella australiensis 50-1 BON]
MAGIDSIIRRIEDDARDKAEQILNDARVEADDIVDAARKKAHDIESSILSEAESDAAEVKRRMHMAAQLRMRKDILAAKQEMIDKAFEQALQRIEAMDAEHYNQYIKRWILSSDIDGDEEIIISAADRGRITPEFIALINEELKAAGKIGSMFLSEEHRDIRGGFVLRKGGIEINSSVEALVRMDRDELESDIARALFGEVE